MGMTVQGEYYSSDYQLGLFEEKEKQSKKYGENCGVCSIVSYSYEGSIKSEKNLRNHIAARMSYIKRYRGEGCGEIVSLLNPVKYLIITPEIIEKECKLKKEMEYQSRIDTKRYAFYSLENDKLNKLIPYENIDHAKSTILNMYRLDRYTEKCKYWLYDRKTGKTLQVQLNIKEVKTTTRVSNDLVHIIPIYKFFYYGIGFDRN